MKYIYILFFISIMFFTNNSNAAGVTYSFSGGRFGDNLLSYLHAKWISYQYQIPLIYNPFPYSSELMLDIHEIRDASTMQFAKTIQLSNKNAKINRHSSVLYCCPYFCEDKWELQKNPQYSFPVDWKNEEFRSIITTLISPKNKLELLHPPKDAISIAMHIRDGGGFDVANHKQILPLKTPPLHFYIDSLLKVLDLFQGHKTYCYFFTDAENPKEIERQLNQMLPPSIDITFHYRNSYNHHDINVLEDFFSLLNFDVLIRAVSNYSIVPSLIHDYAILCYPEEFCVNNSTPIITKIGTEINENICSQCINRITSTQKNK